MRPALSHLLVALVALAAGYAATPWLQRLGPAASQEPAPPAVPEAAACAPWIEEALAAQARLDEAHRDRRDEGEAGPAIEPRPGDSELVTAPEPLEERFTEPILLDTYRRAITESGADVEIASVDCTEYPCIVYGHTVDDQAALDAYLAAGAFEAYAEGAARVLFSWGGARLADSEELRRYFGVVLYPEADRERRGSRIERRLSSRAAQMWDAVRAGGR